ncbi:MAG: FtsX-like permease family protein [Planctomycetes bacterium]|nr:FtsX-like permease family protein [Planctomycetota bacterium]
MRREEATRGDMRRRDLILKSIAYHIRSYIAVLLSAATACAVIAGALLVGDSVRGSLRDHALGRLGRVHASLVSDRFLREDLAADLAADSEVAAAFAGAVPAILLRGSVVHTATGRRAAGVGIVGADERFAAVSVDGFQWRPQGRSAVVNARLAGELGARPGDALLIQFERESDVPRESALGKREDTLQRLRLELSGVRPDEGCAIFDLRNQQATPRNVFVPLGVLQRALDAESRANAILLIGRDGSAEEPAAVDLQAALARAWTLDDLRLRLRADAGRGYLSLESRNFLLEPPAAEGARAAAADLGLPYLESLTYLANSIRAGERSIPYSLITALGSWTFPGGRAEPPLEPDAARTLAERGSLLLNDWAFRDLGVETGAAIEISYYAVKEGGDLEEESASFRVSGSVALEGAAADPGWTPQLAGISDARTFGDWDPPFEIDHGRIRQIDEEYWDEHRTTPKAFVPLADGQALWSSRFGGLTSVRLRLPPGEPPDAAAERAARALLRRLSPEAFGLRIEPTRDRALQAASGGTDFAMLFISMSFFIIVSALLLVAMTYRLALERRSRELGMLSALGFSRAILRRTLLAEGLAVGVAGTAVGIAGGVLYAGALIAGLRSWWQGAVNAPFLSLHVTASSLAIAAAVNIILIAATVSLVARKVAGLSPRALLSGRGFSGSEAAGSPAGARLEAIASSVLVLLAGLFFALAQLGAISVVVAYVAQGVCLFAAGIGFLAWILRRRRPSRIGGHGVPAILRLGALNARRAVGRSLLTAGLIASATFVVVTVAASHQDPLGERPDKSSGNGGFAVMASSSSPIFRSVSTPEGRDDLALSPLSRELLAAGGTLVVAMRERPGDETSCQNLYKPQQPRILGVPRAFIERGGFAWASSLAETAEERENPWLLLEEERPDDVVPAIGDQSSVEWILQSGLGGDIAIEDERGRPVRLRIAGMLARSIFQGALIISEERFLRLFPNRTGWSAFLIECPPERAEPLIEALEADLAEHGFDAKTTAEVLADYLVVQNTYLLTFLVLGGLGLLLGTLGLGATLLRSVLERRGELALLRALGYSRRHLGWLVISESASLLLFGMLLGAAAALIATLPNVIATASSISWRLLAATLLLVLAAGVASCALALLSALRTPLLPALREE